MICYVHVGYDPGPREADSPVEAIALAEQCLRDENDSLPEEEKLFIRWRRDDLYPDNFVEYTVESLTQHLTEKGEVVLQLVDIGADGLPVMGETATIFTDAEEQKNNDEANEALEVLGKNLASSYKTPVTLTSAGQSKTFQPTGEVTVSSVPKTVRKKTVKGKAAASKKKSTMKAKGKSSKLKRRTNPTKKKKK